MEFQQPHHSYMRPPPPPPSMPDPNNHQPSLIPPPPGWFSGQFQYHGHSPPPPNQNHQHWEPPPPPPPYHAHHQYPPLPPPRPTVPTVQQSYRPQEWQNPSWSQHQAHNNGEDWAAKARAWAAAQTSMDDQYPQSQYTSAGRVEESQYSMIDSHYSDGQHFPVATSGYQQYQPSTAPPPYQVSESSFSSGYVPDGHLHFTSRNGSLVGESNAAFPHQESPPSSLSVHQKEVPSSYSSMAGKEATTAQNEQFYKSPWVFTSQQQAQPPPAAVSGTVSVEQPHYAFSHQPAVPQTDFSDQPLKFAPRFALDHDQHVQPNFSHDSGATVRGIDNPSSVSSIHGWSAPVAPGVVYPPAHPSGPQSQVDPSLAIHTPVQGHSGSLFGRISGQNFQPMIPSVSAPFSGTGTFSGDDFGASGVPDRPKKASVPNWLREEIIKKKAVIATSAPESAEDTESIEDEAINKSSGKGYLADSKSIDSSRSTEEEDGEEDEVEIARTAAVNKEIKRVLTEVLLKVTDELFDEIATKVLSEDNPTLAADHNTSSSNHELLPSMTKVPAPKASAKVSITTEDSEADSDITRQSTPSAPGALLGLASYASDDDEDDDNQDNGMPDSIRNTTHQRSTTKMLPEGLSVAENGHQVAETIENQRNNLVLESYPCFTGLSGSSRNQKPDNELNNNGSGRESTHATFRSRNSSEIDFSHDDNDDLVKGVEVVNDADISVSENNVEEKVVTKTELSVDDVDAKKVKLDDTEFRETRNKPDKIDRYDKRQSCSPKDLVKKAGGDESRRKQEERMVKKEKMDDRDVSKEKLKDQSLKSAAKSKDTDSKKRSNKLDDKDIKETEKDRRTSGTEGNDKKSDRTRDERERSRNKLTSDSDRHKRHRSSSVGSKGRDRKSRAVVSYKNDSSDDESSEDSRRKSRSRKRKLSPSPVRSRRRHVSRSPHSKRSHRRHSPYSSLETARGKRSRSRSPARRKR